MTVDAQARHHEPGQVGPAPQGPGSPAAGARLLCVSLDGATFDVLAPLMAAGRMPVLAQLCAAGATGRLRSVVPPTTAPAWMSFQTGVGPGGHGIVDFTAFDPERRQSWFVTAADARATPFWVRLSRAGRRVALLNLPLTHPAPPTNGVVLPGLFAPDGAGYPAGIAEEVRRAVGEYPAPLLAGAYFTLGPRGFVAELHRRAERRGEAALYLLRRERWDFFMVHFQSVDSLQHMLWDRLSTALGGGGDEVGVLDYFSALDAVLGRLVEAAGARWVLVLSDHGFGPLRRLVYVNEWLRREGLVTARASGLGLRLAGWAEAAARRLDLFRLRRHVKLHQRTAFAAVRRLAHEGLIDLDRSRAYALYGSHAAHVYVNRVLGTGRGYHLTRVRVVESLEGLVDPATGERVFDAVLPREEVFGARAPQRLPDVVGLPRPGYHITSRLRGTRLCESLTGGLCGDHRPDGVLVAAGSGIAAGERLEGARLVDLAPTILALLGVAVPAGLEGRPLPFAAPAADGDREAGTAAGALSNDGADGGPARTGGDVRQAGAADAPAYSERELEAIQAHLRGLGYL